MPKSLRLPQLNQFVEEKIVRVPLVLPFRVPSGQPLWVVAWLVTRLWP